MSIFNWGKKKVKKAPAIDFGKGKFLSTKTYGNDRGFSCCFHVVLDNGEQIIRIVLCCMVIH
jgi:hypothetical protein